MRVFSRAHVIWLAIVGRACSSPAPAQFLDKRAACNADNLLNTLRAANHLSDSYQFCSAYISIPATSTVTVYTSTSVLSTYDITYQTIHPLYLYNLQGNYGYPPTWKPISYNSASPTPSTVPGGPQYFNWPTGVPTPQKKRSPTRLERRAGTTLPTYIATTYPASRLSSACSCLSVPAAATTTISTYLYSQQTTTTCISYEQSPTATYPAFCAPSVQANAPAPASHSDYRVVPNFSVASKMDCCAACASVFNCVWFKFDFGTPGDGWQPGICHYAYYIGTTNDPGTNDNQPAICPNGVTNAIPGGAGSGHIGLEANNNMPGYNVGPCGNGFNFESNQDSGYPDDAYLHQCGYAN